MEDALARRFASFSRAPVFLATIDSWGRQISVTLAAVVLSPITVASLIMFHYRMTPILSETGSRNLPPASYPSTH